MSPARERARTFVALPLGAELGALLGARCAGVLDASAFRMARAEGLHVTLHFLGDVEREGLALLAAALRATLGGLEVPLLRLSATGAFPGPSRARVLWVGVEERAAPGRLEACRRAVLAGLSAAGVDTSAEESRPFRPHLTVARPRGGERLPPAFAALPIGLDWNPAGVELLESRLGPHGSHYACLERYPFVRGA